MNKSRKVFVSAVSLLIVAALLVSASFAWFTISTNPEITGLRLSVYGDESLLLSESADGDFGRELDLSDAFTGLADLHPVSTIDGKNWFIPTYSADGALNDPSLFTLDDTYEYANVFTVDENGNPLSGMDLFNAENNGYYVYTEFYIMTESEGGAKVRLSFPHADADGDWALDEGIQGTYVVPKYSFQVMENGTVVPSENNYSAQTAVRVGFLVNPTEKRNSKTGTMVADTDYNDAYAAADKKSGIPACSDRFIIYEPNADVRSKIYGKPDSSSETTAEDKYIAGYDYDADLITYEGFKSEIGATVNIDADDNETVAEYGEDHDAVLYQDGNYIETKPIALVSGDGEDDYQEKSIDPANLIIQKNSSWKAESITDLLQNGGNYGTLTSNDVNIGGFLPSAGVYSAMADSLLRYDETYLNESADHLKVETGYVDLISRTPSRTVVRTVIEEVDGEEEERQVTSTEVLDDESFRLVNETVSSGDTLITTLKANEPLKIRLFIWIEGQDVDCWNDIAAGSFRVNLELSAEDLN